MRALKAPTPGSTKKVAASSLLAVLRPSNVHSASAVVAIPTSKVIGSLSV